MQPSAVKQELTDLIRYHHETKLLLRNASGSQQSRQTTAAFDNPVFVGEPGAETNSKPTVAAGNSTTADIAAWCDDCCAIPRTSKRFASSPRHLHRPWRPSSLLSTGYQGFSGCKVNHLPPSTPEVHAWSYTSTSSYVCTAVHCRVSASYSGGPGFDIRPLNRQT